MKLISVCFPTTKKIYDFRITEEEARINLLAPGDCILLGDPYDEYILVISLRNHIMKGALKALPIEEVFSKRSATAVKRFPKDHWARKQLEKAEAIRVKEENQEFPQYGTPGRGKTETISTNNREKKESKMKKSITSQIKKSGAEAKNTIIQMQKGAAIISALKTSLIESNILPEKAAVFINESPFADILIAQVLGNAAVLFTDSDIIAEAAEAAQFVGNVRASESITVLQSFIEATITKAMAK